MRVVVVGASGNVGTSLLRSLSGEPRVESVLGLARRLPAARFPKVEWAAADIASSDLVPHFRGADAVVHLAWLIQPGRDEATLRATNIDGTARLLRAVAEAGVPSLVYASSVGAYSRGPKDRRVDESWPTHGIGSSFYARHKAQVERMLDRFEEEHSGIRVVRLRPGLIFKREAAAGIRRLFAGPFLPGALLRPDLIPVVHSYDGGDASRLAVLSDARGPFNVAAEPVLDPGELARMLDARTVPLPAAVLRGGAALTFRLRLQPSEPGWVDMALAVPVMDTARARRELGWGPRHTATDALLELLAGMREGTDIDTPPLARGSGGPFRLRELLTGV